MCIKRTVFCKTCRAYTLLILAVAFYIAYIANRIYKRNLQRNTARRPPYTYIVRTPGCNITDFEPSGPTTSDFHAPPTTCRGRPSFIQQKDNVLFIDIEVLRVHYGAAPADINCSYNAVQRFSDHPVADKGVLLKAKKPLHFYLPLQEEYVLVTCKIRGVTVHKEFFMFPLLMNQVERRLEKIRMGVLSGTQEFSVVVLGLSSVSRASSIRYLAETRKYLQEHVQLIELRGYNALGEDGSDNQVAILTGMPWTQTRGPGDFFDDLNLVWKLYAARGYRTLFLEDSPIHGLFHYREKGFRHPPTDFYPRAPLLAMELLSLNKRGDESLCYVANRTRTRMALDYMLSVLSTSRYFFAYAWIRPAVQDDVTVAEPGQVDLLFRDTFLELFRSGVLNRTVVLFLSDYGTRSGQERRTLPERSQDRLPFCLFIFPQTFWKEYPWALKNLRLNQRRLTTPYDVHATLMELAMPTTSSTRTKFATTYGMSLFHEIPEKRTCKDAHLSPHWCSCGDARTFPPMTTLSRKMALFVVDAVNQWLLTSHPGKCHKHVLDEILSVEERSVDGAVDDERYFWLTLKTWPRNVTLDGTVGVSVNGSLTLHGVSRVDRYTMTCVPHRVMEMYCTCR